ncbi:MAG TPA: hypothetical protein VME70_07890 [Mycobacteriales bacterium]|nr:hypothetical protein [Mycobacteriales bacterium]
MASSQLTHRTALAQVSRALLAAVDTLLAEFPEVPSAIVYEKIGEARGTAAGHLPDLAAYQHAIETEARRRLQYKSKAS